MADDQTVPIILIDDDPDEHFLFQADLEDAGLDMTFEAFTIGDDALDYLKQRDSAGPVLVLTDLSIPGGDPVEFIRQALPRLNAGAIGVYSGAKNPDMEAECREAGASFYIVKPVTLDKLVDVVADLGGLSVSKTADGKTRIIAA